MKRIEDAATRELTAEELKTVSGGVGPLGLIVLGAAAGFGSVAAGYYSDELTKSIDVGKMLEKGK